MSRFWWHCIRLFSWLCTTAYYRAFRVEHAERIPSTGPVLFVVNHPNALVDGGAVLRAVPRPVCMAAKSTLFSVPVLGWMLRKLGALPVHRPRDKTGPGGGRQNLKMFDAFTRHFHEGGAAVIFPEGLSHLDPHLKEVKSGAARMVLDAEAEYDFGLGLQVVPIGLHFEPAAEFRGEVDVRIGTPFTVTDLKDTHRRTAIRTVQERIADGLRPLILHLEDVELEPLVRGIAEVYDEYQQAEGGAFEPRPRAQVVQITGAALNHFLVADPEAVELAREKYEWYERLARRTGVRPDAITGHEHPVRTWLAFGTLVLRVVLGFPLFLFGLLTGYLPYRLTDVVARHFAKAEGDVSIPIFRIAWGAIVFGVFWGGLSLVALLWSESWGFTVAFLGLMIACGFYAHYYADRLTRWRARMEGMRPLRRPGVPQVAEAREDLLTYVGGLATRYAQESDAVLIPPRRKKWIRRIPWRRLAAVALLGVVVWFAWGLRGRSVSELGGEISPWQDLPTERAEASLRSDAATLATILDTLDELEARMRVLRAGFESGERDYLDEEDATAIRQALLTYLNCRASLFRMAWFYRQPDRPGEDVQSARAFQLAYAAAVELVRRGMQFVEVFDGKPRAIRKLNEGDPAWGLPPDTYDRVRANLANSEVLEELTGARRRFEAMDTYDTVVEEEWPPHFARIFLSARQGTRIIDRLAEKLWGYKWDAALARATRTVGEGRYELSRFFAVLIGKVRVRGGDLVHGLITQAQVEWLRDTQLQPGDILLERRNWALSNVLLPGFWTHAALYIGGVEGLTDLGILDDEGVRTHLAALEHPDAHGRPVVVLEALGQGVVLNTLEYSVGEADAVCVLRPRMERADLAACVARAMRHHGKPYDFDFDFFSADRLVCTELVYRAYQGKVAFELQEILGRQTLPAIRILEKWAAERDTPDAQMDLICFLDSNEDAGHAEVGDEARLLETLGRPGLTVLQGHGGSSRTPRIVLLVLAVLLLGALFILRPRR